MIAQRITVYDIAKKLGVSHSTVSLALRNHHRISVKRRAEVQKLAKELGYSPDPLLSRLAAHHFKPVKIQSAIAWVNHWEQPERLRKHREFDLYWRGAAAAAKRYGYHLEDIHWLPAYSAKRFEQILLTRGIRGVLIPPHEKVPSWDDFDWGKFSIIRFGLSVPSPDSHLVTADQLRGVIMAVHKMAEYGYQRIGLVMSADYDRRLGGGFVGGFSSAGQSFHLPVVPPFLIEENVYATKPEKALKLFSQWLKRYKPDALLTATNETPAMLRQLSYRIPEDIGVAGTSMDVSLDAGIDQHSEAIGRIAVESLVAQINLNERGEPTDPSRILVESRWRDGKSLPILNKRAL
ncbi:MAG TPA: LacI family DNA-binding transcriptional regulator [Verrucomicrobiae bacterium]|jgi:DNA-binding LacI/PurR family transcriptional regulator